ncbi:MAG TPA: TIGR03619 family F420-dependent LLM class oxidoreductase [Nitrososphaeraceae archaeon]|jgi:probable F420-dependent oxidoreductase|nr:TIGR03619 family F420-dependent LLM class oxidoreductase [Nitrososphaeraceae archaeon]
MKVGMFLPQFGECATKENILYIAKEAEKEGIDSLWVLDRLLWPLNPKTPYAATSDGTLPVEYQNVLDPLTTLTYVAGVTERILLGTSIIDMFFQSPVQLGKRFATLDVLSDGRTIAGLGIGWSKDEYEVSGVPYKDKGTRADEFLQVLKKIWTDEIVEFKGQFYNIPASKIGPKPLQEPHPPILLGGFSPKTFSRIVNYANGWIGIAGFGPLEQLEQMINGLKESTRKLDKDPSNIGIYIGSYPNVLESPVSSNETRSPMTGTIEQIGSDIEQIKAMGTNHIFFGYMYSSISNDMKKMVEVTKQFARFAK